MTRACESSHPSTCQCRQPVVHVAPHGVALWARTGGATSVLAKSFPADADNPRLFRLTDSDWPATLSGFLREANPLDAEAILAVAIAPDGSVDPWQAVPAGQFARRAETGWLPRLLNEGGLTAHYQPIVNLRNNDIVAFEALMRAELDGQTIPAGRIIEAARAHEAMFQFDQQAREAAIRQGWPLLQPGEKLFINFAPTVIYDPAVCLATTWKAANEVGCDLSNLVFEVVESEQFPQIDHLRDILAAYREQGAQVALDDLGSGHTALTYIDELEPDLIKLDRALLPLHPEPRSMRLLEGLVGYAHGRNITVLVEGVENLAQLDAARGLGIDLAQGYLLGRPAATPQRDLAGEPAA